jgi:chromosome partitioning protein
VKHPEESLDTSLTDVDSPLARELSALTSRRRILEQPAPPLPSRPRVFTVSNQKGGVGKTTTTVNIAAALARFGAKVLVIDLDPQGNASTALGINHHGDIPSIYDVLVEGKPLSSVIQKSTEEGALFCAPSNIDLAGAEIQMFSIDRREYLLRDALENFFAEPGNDYHYVFIDCPPSLGLLTINAFTSAREVLIPIQCEYYALEGLTQLLSTIDMINQGLNPYLQVSTILLTMFDSRTRLAHEVAADVRQHFPQQVLKAVIPRAVRVSEAPSYSQTVVSYDTMSVGSISYIEAASEIALRGAPGTASTTTQEATDGNE